jgi:hypothetical protein
MRLLLVILLFTLQANWAFAQQLSFDLFMDQSFALSKEQIFLNEKLMNFEENLLVFKEGHQEGFFYFLHPAIPAYEPYLKFSGFEALLDADRKLYQMALETSSTLYQVKLSPDYKTGRSYPLFIMFHGGNSNFHLLKKHWTEESLDKHFDSESFTWRSGDLRSDRDIRAFLLGGEYDFYLEQQQMLTTLFDKMGLAYTYVLVDGMSHQYPEDESKYIRKGLQFI